MLPRQRMHLVPTVCAVQYAREQQDQQAARAAQGITIGGQGGHTSQFRLRERSPGLAAATQASLDSARAAAAAQVTCSLGWD